MSTKLSKEDKERLGVKRVPQFDKDAIPLIRKAIEFSHNNGINRSSLARYAYSAERKIGAGVTQGGLLYYDIDMKAKFRIMQQSKVTISEWSNMAKKGAKVWQVMLRPGGYFGVILNGDFYQYSRK